LEGFPHDVEAAVLLCCYIGLDVARAPKLHTALSNLHSSLTVVDTATGKRTVLRILALVLDGLLACINGCLFNCLFQMIRWVCLCGDTVDPLERQYENVIKSHQGSFRQLGVHLVLHFCVTGPENLNGTQWRGPGIFFERLPG
jgi:hypothetical protein